MIYNAKFVREVDGPRRSARFARAMRPREHETGRHRDWDWDRHQVNSKPIESASNETHISGLSRSGGRLAGLQRGPAPGLSRTFKFNDAERHGIDADASTARHISGLLVRSMLTRFNVPVGRLVSHSRSNTDFGTGQQPLNIADVTRASFGWWPSLPVGAIRVRPVQHSKRVRFGFLDNDRRPLAAGSSTITAEMNIDRLRVREQWAESRCCRRDRALRNTARLQPSIFRCRPSRSRWSWKWTRRGRVLDLLQGRGCPLHAGWEAATWVRSAAP